MTLVRLISAAGGGVDHLFRAVDDLGMAVVADLVMSEVLHRADLPLGPQVMVRFRLLHGDATAGYEVRVDPGAITLRSLGGEAGTALAGEPDCTVHQSLAEVVRSLFGPRGAQHAATRTLRWRDLDDQAAFGRSLPCFPVVRTLLDAVDHPYTVGLAELCVRYGSDKWGAHAYTRRYERHFAPLRDQPLNILEIGVGGFTDPRRGGASLSVWKRYFPRALVHGMDITDKTALSEQRITVLQGDQSCTDDLAAVAAAAGPFDIVIDDGSHVSAHLLTTFHALWPALRYGGMYIMEDLQTSYWPSFGGRDDTFDDPATSVGFLKTLVDGLNHEEIDGRQPAGTDAAIGALHFYHNLVVIEKESNLDGGAPSWIPRRVPTSG